MAGTDGGGNGNNNNTQDLKGRGIYKLGTHKIRVTENGQRVQKEVPILSNALKRTAQLLQLDEPEESDIKTVEQETGAFYYKRGALAADRIIVEYKEGEDLKTLRIPIPSWAPNYKLIPSLTQKARQAGLELVGFRRHGYLIRPPAASGGESGDGSGGGGGE